MPAKAGIARVTGDMVSHHDPIAFPPLRIYARTGLGNDTGAFVPKRPYAARPACTFDPVPFHDIRPAHSAGHDGDFYLPWSDQQIPDLFGTDVMVRIIDCSFHGIHCGEDRYNRFE